MTVTCFDEDHKPKKISEPQVEMGKRRLKFKHPLSNKTIWEVMPRLKFLKCSKDDENNKKADKDEKKEKKEIRKQNSFYQI